MKQSMHKLGSLLDSRAEEVHCDKAKEKLINSDLLTLLKVWSLEGRRTFLCKMVLQTEKLKTKTQCVSVAFSVTFGKNHRQRIMSHPIEEDILEFIDVVDKV